MTWISGPGGETFAGSLLIVPSKPDIERDAVAMAWSEAGGAVIRLDRFWDPPPLDHHPRAAIYGPETFALVVAQVLGLELVSSAADLIVRLPYDMLRRSVGLMTIDSLDALRFPTFAKSRIPKAFPSQIYASAGELRHAVAGLDEDAEAIWSEIVRFDAEVRCFCDQGRVLTAGVYKGDADPIDAASHAEAVLRTVHVEGRWSWTWD